MTRHPNSPSKLQCTVKKLWDIDLTQAPYHVKFPVTFLRLLMAVMRDVREGDLRLRATSLVYTTMLSLAPMLALCFSVLKGFGIHNQIEPVLSGLLEPLGDKGIEITEKVIGFVSNIKVGVLGAVGLLFLVYSVITLMHEIEKSMNYIWRVRKPRRFGVRIRNHLSLILIGPFFMFLSVAITTGLRHADILKAWLGDGIVENFVEWSGMIVAWGLFTMTFAALYAFMPNTRVQFMPALAAGAVTAALWKALGWLFGVFVAGSASYAAVYSAFAALVLFVLWVYIGWLLVLVGALICYYLQNPSNMRLSRREKTVSARVRERIALQICAIIGHSFYQGQKMPTAKDLAREMRVPVAVVDSIIEDMAQAGLLTFASGRDGMLIPLCPFDDVTIDMMLQNLRKVGEGKGIANEQVKVSKTVEAQIKIIEDAQQKATGKMTLKRIAT